MTSPVPYAFGPPPASPAPYVPGPYPPLPAPGYAPVQQVFVTTQAQPTSGMATASLVLGIIGVLGGWCMFGIPCLLAIIFGHVALPQTRDGRLGGRGLAVAGLVLGYIAVAPMIFLTLSMFFGLAGAATVPATAP